MEQLHRNLMKNKIIITPQIQGYIEILSFNNDVKFLYFIVHYFITKYIFGQSKVADLANHLKKNFKHF